MSAIEFPMSTALPSSRAVLLFRSRRYDKYKLARFLPKSLLNCCSIHYVLSEIYILLRKSYGMMNPYPRYRPSRSERNISSENITRRATFKIGDRPLKMKLSLRFLPAM